ncbi:MAG: type II toxin-antitoxin system HicA family toxin [Deltaproteobacteria bacterium]|nr:type II toxin-antitoxin system HicA family toxin [Deltaproteobacteria bacterium]
MKKRDLERELRKLGWYFKREGGCHEIWTDGEETMPVPRHKEVNENTARGIIRDILEIKEKKKKGY